MNLSDLNALDVILHYCRFKGSDAAESQVFPADATAHLTVEVELEEEAYLLCVACYDNPVVSTSDLRKGRVILRYDGTAIGNSSVQNETASTDGTGCVVFAMTPALAAGTYTIDTMIQQTHGAATLNVYGCRLYVFAFKA